MLVVSSFCASLLSGRDAMNEREGVAAAQLCAATTPSQQHYNLLLKWSFHRRVSPGSSHS